MVKKNTKKTKKENKEKRLSKTTWDKIDKVLENQEGINIGKEMMYSEIMDLLEFRQIDSKPNTEMGQGFVDGYNCGIRDAMRIVYRTRYFDWDDDRDSWNIDPAIAGEAWDDLYNGKY
jgi:hypothetical protein